MLKPIVTLLLTTVLIACDNNKTHEEYLKAGQNHLKNKDTKSAIIAFKNAVKQDPKSAEARYLLGQVYIETFSIEAASIEFEKAITLGKKDGETLLAFGKSLYLLNEDKKLLEEVKPESRFDDQTIARIHALRFHSLFRTKRKKEAIKALELAQKLDPSNPEVRLAWASFEKSNNNTAEQKKWLEPLIQEGQTNADAWSQMAEIEHQQGNLLLAEKYYSKAISLRGGVHPEIGKRALIRISQNDIENARKDLARLKESPVKWPITGHLEGVLAYKDKKYDEAQAALEGVLATYPTYSLSHFILGLTHYEKGNYQKTISYLNQYYQADPENLIAGLTFAAASIKSIQYTNAINRLNALQHKYPENTYLLSLLATAYIGNNELDRGIEILKQVVEIQPANAQARLQLGTVLLQTNSGTKEGQQQILESIYLDPDLQQADLMLFSSYMKENNISAARKFAQSIEKNRPDSGRGSQLIAQTYIQEGNNKKAIQILQAALEKFPADPELSNTLGKIYIADKNYREAKLIYENVLSKHPDDENSYQQLAVIARNEQDGPSVFQWLRAAVDANPGKLSPYLTLANHYLENNDARSAFQLLQEVPTEQREEAQYQLMMGRTKVFLGESAHAIRLLKSVIAKIPDSDTAHYWLANAYALDNQIVKSRELLETAISINPELLVADIAITKLDLAQRRYDEFKKRVTRMFESNPDNLDVQFLNAKVYTMDGKYADAITTLKAIASNFPTTEVILELASNQWLLGQRDNAIKTLESWQRNHPDDISVLIGLAEYYRFNNQFEKSIVTYQTLAEKLPNDAPILNNLAFLLKDSDPQKGLEYSRRALKVDQNNPYVMNTLALLLVEIKQMNEALGYSEKAAAALPESVDIQIDYANVLMANNKHQKAEQVLKSILQKTEDSEERRKINNALKAM